MDNIVKEVWLIANGDQREAANKTCWPAQKKMEQLLGKALAKKGFILKRVYDYDTEKKHGFINSQKMGIEVFKHFPTQAPLIVAESVWQYSQFVLPGLMTHKGPILTVANWDGQWPGLVGLLNLNASLTKAGVSYSTLWSEAFDDPFFEEGLEEWLQEGHLRHDQSHVKDFSLIKVPVEDEKFGREFGREFRQNKAIIGVFDEGCMGMYNAIIPDDLLNQTGVYKERLSQSTLYAKMQKIKPEDAQSVLDWLLKKGMKFNWGTDGNTQLTKEQTLEQCKMYIAAMRIADEFGCAAIGIQYQQGMMDLCAASDLAEGLMNNTDRPPVFSEKGKELYRGHALPHFNEVDECAGLDALVTYHLWNKLGMPAENTLHDIRWGAPFRNDGQGEDFVWLFMISGAVPAAHLKGGYQDAVSERQTPMFFKPGGGTLKGVSKPGYLVWSRIYVMNHALHCDMGIGKSVQLPESEINRRWQATNPEWPMMNAILPGISRDQMMGRHKSNHIHVVYTPDESSAHKSCRIKASALAELGVSVHFCGDVDCTGEIHK